MTIEKARDTALGLIAHDYKTALALLDGVYLTSADAIRLISEVPVLRAQGAPESAFVAWHQDLCELLQRLQAEADAPKPGRQTP